MLIRPAELSDVHAMAAIRAREWETEPYWLNRIGAYLGGSQSEQHSLPDRSVFVAVDEATVVGFVAGHRTRRYGCDGELQWINVVRERRGEGIADKLMVRMGEWFVEHNLRRICVDVEPQNVVARALYSRFGAKPFKPYWLIWDDAQHMATGPATGCRENRGRPDDARASPALPRDGPSAATRFPAPARRSSDARRRHPAPRPRSTTQVIGLDLFDGSDTQIGSQDLFNSNVGASGSGTVPSDGTLTFDLLSADREKVSGPIQST